MREKPDFSNISSDSDFSESEERIFKDYKDEIRHELKREFNISLKDWDVVKGRKLPATLSRGECVALMTAHKEGVHRLAFRNNLIVRMLYATGMRVEELQNLKFCDVNYDSYTVFVRAGKGDKDRYVCIEGGTLEMVRKWQEGKGLSESVFGLTVRQLRRVVEKAGDLTGISEKYDAMGRVFSCHSLRHAYATHCFENGMRVITLQRLMGHEYMGTTKIYLYTAKKYDVLEYFRTHPLKGEPGEDGGEGDCGEDEENV